MTVKAFGDIARVSVLPECDICPNGTKAEYDARTPSGQWGNLCERHFNNLGCQLGLGRGQKLVIFCDYCLDPEKFSKESEPYFMLGCNCK